MGGKTNGFAVKVHVSALVGAVDALGRLVDDGAVSDGLRRGHRLGLDAAVRADPTSAVDKTLTFRGLLLALLALG